MSKFLHGVLSTGVLLLYFLSTQTTAHADAVVVNDMYKVDGTNVFAKFDITDNATNAFDGLPRTFRVDLLAGSTVVGSFPIELNNTNVTQNSRGYITSAAIEHTFPSATGHGTGFSLRLTPVPEPATLILFGSGLAGVVASVRRRRKNHLKT